MKPSPNGWYERPASPPSPSPPSTATIPTAATCASVSPRKTRRWTGRSSAWRNLDGRPHHRIDAALRDRVIPRPRLGIDAPGDRLAPFGVIHQHLEQRLHELAPRRSADEPLRRRPRRLVAGAQRQREPCEKDLRVTRLRQPEVCVELAKLLRAQFARQLGQQPQ